MKYIIFIIALFGGFALSSNHQVEAKSYIKSYTRSSGVKVNSYTRYKADGYKFNNYSYRPDRGYRR